MIFGADQVRSDDDREALKVAIRAIRQAKGNPQQMANILRVLSLVSMLDSASALSLVAPEEPFLMTTTCLVVCAAAFACLGLMRIPMPLVCVCVC